MSNPSDNTPNPQNNPWIYSAGPAPTPPPPAEPQPSPAESTPPIAEAPQPVPPPDAQIAPVSAPPPVASRPPGPPPKKDADDASLASVIDTIEAIIIALVIALTFRAFIVEAFVIPTGSMAPTLLGAHFKVTCPECGYEFDYNAQLSRQAVRVNNTYVYPNSPDSHAELVNNELVPVDGLPVYCPNCRYPISAKQLPQFLQSTDVHLGNTKYWTSFAWANNGDRILVLKYLYAVQSPNRWDVIVFKEPQEARDNFIKRLIGKPEETVEIIGGDIYITPPGEDPNDLTRREIARKPEAIQPNLWQLVYDNDYYPKDAAGPGGQPGARPSAVDAGAPKNSRPLPETTPPFENPWKSTEAWQKGPVMRYATAGRSTLRFDLSASQTAGSPYTLNTLGYNNDIYVDWGNRNEFAPRSFVGDLRMEMLWKPQDDAAAGVSLVLGRPNNCYRVDWSANALVLSRYNAATGQFDAVKDATISAIPAPAAGQGYRLALNNVDHALRFYVDGRKVINYEQPWSAADAQQDERLHPADEQQKPDTMIQVSVNGPCSLAHLKLYRDLYYTQVNANFPSTGTEGKPITLRKGEYFALGDNSRESADGRLWPTVYPALGDLGIRPGIVPERYLLGKAFFVYWPAGFRPADQLPYPIIPDAGDMRVIR